VSRLERAGLGLALMALGVLVVGPDVPASWSARAAVVLLSVGAALVVDPWRRTP